MNERFSRLARSSSSLARSRKYRSCGVRSWPLSLRLLKSKVFSFGFLSTAGAAVGALAAALPEPPLSALPLGCANAGDEITHITARTAVASPLEGAGGL